jgi:hypothetical protein
MDEDVGFPGIGLERPAFWENFHHARRFKVIGEMYRVREFRLVLCANVRECFAERAIQVLEGSVEVERKNGGLDYLLGGPLIISEIRSPRAPVLNTESWLIHNNAL